MNINNYSSFAIFLLLILIAISLFKYLLKDEKEKSLKRKHQSTFLYSIDTALKRAEKRFEKAPIRKKAVVEKIIAQSGQKMSYETLMVRRVLFAIGGAFFGLIILRNIVMGTMFTIVGYVGYWEYIKFLRNKRIEKIDSQIGPFISILTERWLMTEDIVASMAECEKEFRGIEPLHSEIKRSYYKITSGGETVDEALYELAVRSGNIFMKNFARYYSSASEIGSKDISRALVPQAFKQYESNRKMKVLLKREISEPVKTAYMMVGALIGTVLYQVSITEEFWKILSTSWYGNLILAYICTVTLTSIWIINVKLSGIIDNREVQEKKSK